MIFSYPINLISFSISPLTFKYVLKDLVFAPIADIKPTELAPQFLANSATFLM